MSDTPLTNQIENLTTLANAATGVSDTTLTAAVGRLIAGYGGELWKSETLSTNKRAASITVETWLTYFGITEQDILDGYVYLMTFSGNIIDTSSAYVIIFYPKSDGSGFGGSIIRDGGNTVTSVLTRYAWATEGTQIDVYKIRFGGAS